MTKKVPSMILFNRELAFAGFGVRFIPTDTKVTNFKEYRCGHGKIILTAMVADKDPNNPSTVIMVDEKGCALTPQGETLLCMGLITESIFINVYFHLSSKSIIIDKTPYKNQSDAEKYRYRDSTYIYLKTIESDIDTYLT